MLRELRGRCPMGLVTTGCLVAAQWLVEAAAVPRLKGANLSEVRRLKDEVVDGALRVRQFL